MPEKLEKLIKLVYKIWKGAQPAPPEAHPDEETLACFLENKLSAQESEGIKAHLIHCERCVQIISAQLKMKTIETREIPEGLLAAAKNLVPAQDKISILEIYLKVKEKFLELLNTTGDVLVGQELVPARDRQPKDFKDEVTILKDFQDFRVEAKIENKLGRAFSLTVVVKEKATQKIMKDLRVTLIKDDLELESYLAEAGKVTFEHVLLGRYTVEISTPENKIASILLEIKT